MTRRFWLAVAALGLALAPVRAADTVEFTLHSGHFESNKSGLKGDSSYLHIKDQLGFDKIFGTVPPLGAKKHNWVPKGTFEKSAIVAVIKRGTSTFTYSDVSVTLDGTTLKVSYKAVGGQPSTANFATPLILSVPKDKFKKVVFIENGKEAGTAE
jgi:hypothetical protein